MQVAQVAPEVLDSLQDALSSDKVDKPYTTRQDPSKSLGGMPQEIYTKQAYCPDSMLYLIMPKHKVAIPYGIKVTPKLLETIADTLVRKSDLVSSQEITDYPIVTHVQLEMWYDDYEVIEQLKSIPVYKPRKALSGWEELRRTKTRRKYLDTVKAMKEKEEERIDPFLGGEDIVPLQPNSYAISPERLAEIQREGK